MRSRGRLGALLLGGMLAAAAPARAQFVSLTRCHGAFPCDRPFGLQYRPDPLIAGPYSSEPSSAVSAHIELKKKPEVELDKPLKMSDAVDASVKAFLRRHPAPKREPAKAPAEKPAAPPADPPQP
jgi:hypothetical protein